MNRRAERSKRSSSARASGRLALAAAILAAASVTACQTFQPAEPSGLQPGQTVRVELADSVTRARAGWTGPSRDRLTGQVVRTARDGLDLSVRSRVGGASLSPYRDTLSVPASVIRSVQRQRLSAVRSAAVAGGVVGAAALLFSLDITGGGSAPPSNGGGATESIGISVPLFP